VKVGGKSESVNWNSAQIFIDDLDLLFGEENYTKDWIFCVDNTSL
jgi:hypothetical protein